MTETRSTNTTRAVDVAPGEQQSLAEYAAPATAARCQAIAEYTGERCEHDALPGCDYCAHHR
jgi:hypothetical protein